MVKSTILPAKRAMALLTGGRKSQGYVICCSGVVSLMTIDTGRRKCREGTTLIIGMTTLATNLIVGTLQRKDGLCMQGPSVDLIERSGVVAGLTGLNELSLVDVYVAGGAFR